MLQKLRNTFIWLGQAWKNNLQEKTIIVEKNEKKHGFTEEKYGIYYYD